MPTDACNELRDLLVDFADDELVGQERLQMETHLRQCPECREELRMLQRSLQIAEELWASPISDESAAARPDVKLPAHKSTACDERRSPVLAVAASALVLATAGVIVWSAGLREDAEPNQVVQNGPVSTELVDSERVYRGIEEQVQRARQQALDKVLEEIHQSEVFAIGVNYEFSQASLTDSDAPGD